MAQVDLNQNMADCIHSATHFTHSTYYNICNNTQTDVYFGVWDYVGILLLLAIGLVVLGMFLGILFKMMGDF